MRVPAAITAVVILCGVAVLGARANPEQRRPNVVFVTGFCTQASLVCRPFERATWLSQASSSSTASDGVAGSKK